MTLVPPVRGNRTPIPHAPGATASRDRTPVPKAPVVINLYVPQFGRLIPIWVQLQAAPSR